ncbi:ABC transporter substrate-binding protein [Streptomyces sp. M19]
MAKAKRLLREAGHADGLTVTLHTTTSYPGMDTAATLYAQQLSDIGVTAKVRVDPADTYFTDVYAKKGFYTGYYGGISFPDLVRVGLLSTSPTNETAWRDKEFDEGFDSAMATLDATERNRLLAGIQRTLWKDGGYVVWGTGDGLDLAASGVRGCPTAPGSSACSSTAPGSPDDALPGGDAPLGDDALLGGDAPPGGAHGPAGGRRHRRRLRHHHAAARRRR